MKIIDVTLRDGGFINDFNWSAEEANSFLDIASSLSISYLEIGYWKQSSKSKNKYYGLNENSVTELGNSVKNNMPLSIMIDYHYCVKDLQEYPIFGSTRVEMLRLTSRKEDLDEALSFAKALKDKTNLLISFQLINIANYSQLLLNQVIEKIISSQACDIVGLADSHGNLNLLSKHRFILQSLNALDESNIKWGFHLHDHTHRATLNYWILQSTECSYIDASLNGLGKGGGNLRLEDIIRNEEAPLLLAYMTESESIHFRIPKWSAYCKLTGRMSCTDNYARIGLEESISMTNFALVLEKLIGQDKDTYNPDRFKSIYSQIKAR